MRTAIGRAAVLFVLAGLVTNVAANGDAAGVADKRGLTPIVPIVQSTARQFDRVIGICHLSENPFDPTSAVNSMSTPLAIKNYFRNEEHYKIEGQANVSVLQLPAHGTLEDVGKGNYAYYPEKGYIGNDRATLLVEVGGKKIKVEYFFRVMKSVPDSEGLDPYKDFCPKKLKLWKISSITDTNGNNYITAVAYQ